MMNVEQIQKINSLALELMKQGLASDRENAIAQAEQIYKGNAQEYNEMKDTLHKVQEQKSPEPVEETSQVALSQDQIKDILKQNTEYIVSQLKGFHEKVANLEREVSTLKNKVRLASIPTVKEIVADKVPEPVPSQESPEAAPAPEKEAHPKGGDYNVEDVAVEKMFYFGNK